MKFTSVRITLLLLAGAIFAYFSNGRYSFALAAWLFPVFILLVSRKEKLIYASLVIPLLFGVCMQAAFWKFTYQNTSQPFLFFLPFILGVVIGYLFLLERILYNRMSGFTATLVFPLLYTSFDFLLSRLNPFGSMGALGYTQSAFLSFSQLAAITGMWGLTFMITWFSSVVSWSLEDRTGKSGVRKGQLCYFSILMSILIFGIIRLNIPVSGATVRVAGIHCHDKRVEGEQMNAYLDNKDTVGFKKVSDGIIDKLIRETVTQSIAGAKIIVWSEISSKILKRDEDSLVKVLKALALQQKIYLVTDLYTLSSMAGQTKPENKVMLFSPDGELVLTHYKYGGNFMEGTVEGDKIIHAVQTPYGKVASIICWDGDFPSIVRQTGQLKTDILIIPASDWEQIDPLHTMVAVYRGIENGCSVVRQTRNGLSIMTDPRGRVITKMDHFANSSWVMSGEVPVSRWFTLYVLTGDLFGWLALAGLLLFAFKVLIGKKRTR